MAATAESAPVSEPKVKPTKPDEEVYKATLEAAEKELAASQEKLVRCVLTMLLLSL